MNSTIVPFGYVVPFKITERIFCEIEYPENKWKPSAGYSFLEHKINFYVPKINIAWSNFNERLYKVPIEPLQ